MPAANGASLLSTSARPRGLPIAVVARVYGAPSAADLQVSEKRIAIGIDTFDLSAVYNKSSATLSDVFEHDVAKMIPAACDGFNTCVMSIGQTGSGKSEALFGQESGSGGVGVATQAVGALFNHLRQRALSSPGDDFEVAVQWAEVYNDALHDLLVSSTAPAVTLNVEEGEYGVCIPRLRSQPCVDEHEFAMLMGDAVSRRTRANTEHGPFSERASCIMLLTIAMRVKGTLLRSKMLFAELPGTEKLTVDIGQLRASEGMSINREMIAFASFGKSLSDPEQADFANCHESRTTEMLAECMGGNSITLALLTLNLADTAATLSTLRQGRQLRSINNYPIVNDERNMGLLRSLRLRCMALGEEVKGLRSSAAAATGHEGGGDGQASKAMVVDLQGKIISAERGRSSALNEKQKVVTMLTEVRGKYRDLLQTKSVLQSELINSEEERLRLSKTLIDMQMQEADLKESLANEKYELETKLLTSEGDIVELQMREKRLSQETNERGKRIEESERERTAMSLEYVALRQNYDNVFSDLSQARAKNETLGLELLNLVNAKKDLEEKKAALEDENTALDSIAKDLTSSRQKLADDLSAVQASERVLRVENENLSLVSIKKDVELKQLQTEFELKKVSLERAHIDFVKEKDGEMLLYKQMAEKESHKILTLKLDAEKSNERLQSDVKIARRRLIQVESELAALADVNSAIEAETAQLKERVAQQAEGYRRRLLQFVNEAGKSDVGGDGASRSDPKMLLGDLVGEHGVLEAQQRAETEEARAQQRIAARKLRKLSGLYRELVNYVEDGGQVDGAPKVFTTAEVADLTQEVAANEASWQAEIDGARARLVAVQAELETCKEDHVRQAEEHKRNALRLKRDVDESGKAREQVAMELHAVKTAHAALITATQALSATTQEVGGVTMDMLNAIKKELEVIKGNTLHGGGGGGGSAEATAFARDQLEAMRRENDRLREKGKSSGSRAPSSRRGVSGGTSGASTEEVQSLQLEIANLRQQIKVASEAEERVLKGSGDPGAQLTSAQVEAERAALSMRCARAEVQLKQFQDYLAKQMAAFDKERRGLKKQIAEWKAKAAQAAGASAAIK